jgi:hypothetical protein
MAACFVIQPFDAGKFDSRFDEVFKPAIIAAGLDAYRVDRDPAVDVPIDAIENGIDNGLIANTQLTDQDDYVCDVAFVTDKVWKWIESNDSLFMLRKIASTEFPDNDIPF